MYDSLLYFGIVTIASLITPDYNFFFKMITIDSLFNAIHFFKMYINKNLTESQIITKTNDLYKGSLLDRYIYYISIYLLYKSACIFFWLFDSFLLYYLGIVTIIPSIINIVLESKLFQIIREKKELLVKIIISKIFAIVIKLYSKMYLEKEIKIKYKEILLLFKDYKETISYFCDVVKNLLIIIVLSYVKDYSTKLYYGVIKYIYNYKTGNLLESYNCEGAKGYLIYIIDNRKWGELMKPNAYKAILHLYQINNDKSEILKKIITNFNFSIIKMVTIWTVASLLNNIYLIQIISLAMLIYKIFIKKISGDNLGEIIMILFSGLLSYFYNNFLVVSVFSQFGSKILFNKITLIMIKTLYKSIKKKIYKIFMRNKELAISYIVTVLYSLCLKMINIDDVYLVIALNLLANILMSIEIKKQMIFGILITTAQFSNYEIFHIIFNSFVLYLITGLLDITNIMMTQDYLRLYIDNLLIKIKLILLATINNLKRLYKKYLLIRISFRNKLKSFLKLSFYRKDKNQKLIFELMDKEKFPSVTIDSFEDSVSPSNEECRSISGSLSIDDEIFTQSDEAFINGISVNENESIETYKVIKKIKDDNYCVDHNYFE